MFFILPNKLSKVNAQKIYTLPTSVADFEENSDSGAKSRWLKDLAEAVNKNEKATIHGYLASAYRESGNLTKAINHWEEAIKIYQIENNFDSLAKTLTDQAQAYLSQGNFRKAIKLLMAAIETAQKTKAGATETVAWGALGNAMLGQSNYEEALSAYQKSLQLANTLNSSEYTTIALNNLVNAFESRSQRYFVQAQSAESEGDTEVAAQLLELGNQDLGSAIQMANRALKQSKGGMPQVRALINLMRLSPRNEYQTQAVALLESLPDSRSKAYTIINFAETLDSSSKIKTLEWANSVAKNIGDFRAQSFALGALGNIYELNSQFDKALKTTLSAQEAAQLNGDSLYRWQWQAGRIHKATGNPQKAIAAYKSAIATLQSIRSDIVAASSDLQFDVRDEVEPVYRELMALLLDKGQVSEALGILDLLKLTELQDFFGDECLEVTQPTSTFENIAKSNNEVLVYSIILEEKTYIVLRLPNGKLKSYPVALTAKQVQSEVEQFRFALEDPGKADYFKLSQKLYNLLIRPLEADLAGAKPSALVFINDGILRNIPMAALHDGNDFLIEKYPMYTALGFEVKHKQQPQKAQKVLIFGLTVEIPPFAELPNVNNETQIIQDILGGDRYLNENFTLSNLQNEVQKENYPIIHIATHGKFSGTVESTFLQAFDEQIFLREFEEAIRKSKNSIELLTLSACQTAAGDNRSTLGLAGVAVRNGVENVLASLWFINDANTVPLIKEFYNQLSQSNITKAEALRNAQMKLIANSHPAVWSAFVLVSN